MSPPVSFQPRPYLLANKTQHYAWGSKGRDAFIPRLLGIAAKPGLPYAELWIGTHPKAPSEMILGDVSAPLPGVISQYPLQMLGERVSRRFSGTLPFLFKVLSVAEPLSIQAHPNKEQAQALHARDPEHYPDDNHKPELAIALDSLTALVGFKSLSDILHTLERYPELAHFIGPDTVPRLRRWRQLACGEQRDLLRSMYSNLVRRATTRQPELVACICRLEGRLLRSEESLTEEEQLFLTLRETRPRTDVGLLSVFLLNPIHLEAGEGVFIEPGTLHAYMRGNIVECMASSDNVVRAGLTPKFQDFGTIVDILNYDMDPIPILGQDAGREPVTYQTPAAEFQVSRRRLKRDEAVLEVAGGELEILLITKGDIRISWQANSGGLEAHFRRGQSLVMPASMGEFRMIPQSPAEVFRVQVPLG
jgi:mannose-6-phosphate isomerase